MSEPKNLSAGLAPEALTELSRAILEALDHAGVGFSVSLDEGEETRPFYFSPRAAEILGYPLEDLLRRPPLANLAPEEIPRLLEQRRRRLAGEAVPSRYETTVLTKDGRRVPIEVGITTVPYRDRRAWVAFFTDIADRRQMVDALERSEARFRQLIEAAPESITVLRDGRFVYVNPATVRLLGYGSADELLGRSAADVVHPDDVLVLRERLRQLMEVQGPTPPHEYRILRKDGATLYLEISSIRIDWEGQPAVLGFGRDTTARRAMEARLVQADRLATVGTMAAGVAHEINNPLSYVLLNLDYLARELPKLADDPARLPRLLDKLADAREGADRVATIVKDLLSFARSEDSWGPVDLRRTLDAAIKMVRGEIARRARLVKCFDDVPAVMGNEARYGQVFLNLLINAVQALPEGAPERHEIRVATRVATDGRVVVEVADTGPGIPPEHVSRIFDPFFTTKPAGTGTGLGLSICHSIVTGFGGELAVESELGRGTSFRVIVPPAGAATAVAT